MVDILGHFGFEQYDFSNIRSFTFKYTYSYGNIGDTGIALFQNGHLWAGDAYEIAHYFLSDYNMNSNITVDLSSINMCDISIVASHNAAALLSVVSYVTTDGVTHTAQNVPSSLLGEKLLKFLVNRPVKMLHNHYNAYSGGLGWDNVDMRNIKSFKFKLLSISGDEQIGTGTELALVGTLNGTTDDSRRLVSCFYPDFAVNTDVNVDTNTIDACRFAYLVSTDVTARIMITSYTTNDNVIHTQ